MEWIGLHVGMGRQDGVMVGRQGEETLCILMRSLVSPWSVSENLLVSSSLCAQHDTLLML